MAQLINITVQALNGIELTETPHVLFPTQGIVVTQLIPSVSINGANCVSSIKVLATNETYYTTTTVGDIADEANA